MLYVLGKLNVLKTLDPTLVDPCSGFHVTCNRKNSVIRVQVYVCIEVFANNLTGIIPKEIGNLTKLGSLDLQLNKLAGPIPSSLGNLVSLLFLYFYIGLIYYLVFEFGLNIQFGT
ncbi:hypothetical protein Goklo_025672 [Gossypium klotzschianum]|uniref:Leucine-rich repeat-containing N-terminal plant-type domain-containing protein n=1 Tax=Gossypium klotzschianum TaxID=34286 RepID=A0A7J8TSA4_9ROSI|nr:hypothetical protein [Gossypium klotzschianum]